MQGSSRVLVTGATGFIGGHLQKRLIGEGVSVRCAVQHGRTVEGCELVETGNFATFRDFGSAVSNCDAVVHLAGRAHVFDGSAPTLFRAVNVDATLALAEAAAAAKVKKFVFVSSIGVYGSHAISVSETTPFSPADPYAESKLEAERTLRAFAASTDIQLTIVRPPLVYGPRCPGNLRRLAGLVARGLPLPFASITNHRSMISVSNLCDFILLVLADDRASSEDFVVADTDALSTADVIRCLADGMGRRARLVPFPVPLLSVAARIAGLGTEMTKLTSTFVVDSSKARRILGWVPRMSAPEGLREVGKSYR